MWGMADRMAKPFADSSAGSPAAPSGSPPDSRQVAITCDRNSSRLARCGMNCQVVYWNFTFGQRRIFSCRAFGFERRTFRSFSRGFFARSFGRRLFGCLCLGFGGLRRLGFGFGRLSRFRPCGLGSFRRRTARPFNRANCTRREHGLPDYRQTLRRRSTFS